MTPSLAPTPAVLLNPALLALGGLLIAVPILIHLFNRRRVQRLPWAAMQWLLAAMKRHQRRLRIENWLILLLRIAAVLLLGLALARPVLTDSDLAGLVAGKRSVYLVVDTSYSMAARTQGRAVVDVAKAEADAVLSSLGSEDTVAVIVTNDVRATTSDGRSAFAVVPRSVGTGGAAKAKEAVAALRTRDAPANWADALTLARRETAVEDVNRLVVVITDLQARDWREEPVSQALTDLLALPASVRLIDVGGKERRNLVVAEVRGSSTRDAFVERPLRLDVTIENDGPLPVTGARVSAFLDANPTPLRTVVVPPLDAGDAVTGQPGSSRVVLDLPGRSFPKPGSHVVRVEVVPPADDPAADSLGLDSRRGFAMRVRDRVRVLAWTRTSERAGMRAESYLRGVFERWDVDERGERVRERSPLYELTTVGSEAQFADTLSGRASERVDLVVLANVVPRGRAADLLFDFVRGGGALLTFVGDAIPDAAAWNETFHADEERRLLPLPFDAPELVAPASDETPFTLDLERPTGHPLAAPFHGEEAASWIGLMPPAIWGRMAFLEDAPPAAVNGDTEGSGDAPDTRIVLRFGDGRPAVIQGDFGSGKSVWIATSLDHGWLERSFFFLPVFLDEAAVLLTRPDDARRNLEVGRRLVVTWLPRHVEEAVFIAPGGTEVQPTRYEGLDENSRAMFVLDRVGSAGTWRLVHEREGLAGATERIEEPFAVNPDAGEGRLARARNEDVIGALPPESDVQILSSWNDVEDESKSAKQGEISLFVLWIVIALLVLESLLAFWFGRRSRAAAAAV